MNSSRNLSAASERAALILTSNTLRELVTLADESLKAADHASALGHLIAALDMLPSFRLDLSKIVQAQSRQLAEFDQLVFDPIND